jgi:C4-type Zn-finger protein
MSLNLYFNEPCPKCGKPTMQSEIDPHPSRTDVAIQNFHCADCGPIKTVVLSLKPGKPSSELTA